MFSKEGIRAEEFKHQLGDRIPIAMRALERSSGKAAKELLKLMELGQLDADMIVPFAKAMGDIAREGGALEAAMKTTRVTQAGFMTAAQESGDLIFRSGFSEGLSGLFRTLTEELGKNRHSLIGLGQIYKWFFDAISLGVKFLSPLVDSIIYIFGEFAQAVNMINDYVGNKLIGNILAATLAFGTLHAMGARFKLLGIILGFVFKPFVAAALAASLLVIGLLDEIFALFEKGRIGILEEYVFGEDIDLSIQQVWDFINNLRNFDFAQMGRSFGEGLVEGITYALDFLKAKFSDIDWTKVIKGLWEAFKWGFTLIPKYLMDALFGSLSFLSGIIEGIFKKDGIDTSGFTKYIEDQKKDADQFFGRERGDKPSVDPLAVKQNSLTPLASTQNSVSTNKTTNTQMEVKTDISINANNLGSPEDRKILVEEMDTRLKSFWESQMDHANIVGVN